MNDKWLKNRRCAQCWGKMQLIDGELYCPNECNPGGHVSLEYVDRMKARETLDAAEVAEAYPEIANNDPEFEPISDSRIRYAKRVLGMGDGTRPAPDDSEVELFK